MKKAEGNNQAPEQKPATREQQGLCSERSFRSSVADRLDGLSERRHLSSREGRYASSHRRGR